MGLMWHLVIIERSVLIMCVQNSTEAGGEF